MASIVRVLSILLMVAILVSGGIASPVAAVGGVDVTVAAPAMVVTGSDFTANINISQVSDFDAANYDISFDPTVLQSTDTVPGENITAMYGLINGTVIPVVFVNLIHEGTGISDPTVIRLVNNVSGTTGVNGTGYLARLHFQAIGPPGASTNISSFNGTLSSSFSQEIPANWGEVEVTITTGPSLTVVTDNATNITTTSATLMGRLLDLGGLGSANVSFEWGINTNYGGYTANQSLSTNTTFSTNLVGLSPNTTYHFRAKAVSDVTTVFGGDRTFTTPLINVLRDLPPAASVNSTFTVSVNFSAPASQFNAIGLTDFAPSGWTVTVNNTMSNPAADSSLVTNNKVEIIWFNNIYTMGTSFVAAYQVTVPPGTTPGTYAFSAGTLEYYLGSTGPYTANITGETLIQVIEGTRIQGTTYEVNGTVMAGATLTLDSASSVTSDGQGNYVLVAATTGQHTIVASKTGFRNYSKTFTITDPNATYTVDFKANDGLIPNAPNLSYVLNCINKWKFPPAGFGLSLSKVLAVINAWKFPITQ